MPDRKSAFTRTEIKAGLLVIASAVVLALFVAAVMGLRPPRPVKLFYADFVNIKGLHKGADVLFGGLVAGKVRNIAFRDDDYSRIRVEFDVLAGVPVNAESKARIEQTTLTSENVLGVTTGSGEAPLLESGTLLESQEGGIFDLAQMVGDEVNELLGDVRDLLGAKDRTEEETVTIADLVENLEVALDESTGAIREVRDLVESNRDEAERVIKKVEDVEDLAYGFVGDLRQVVEENRQGIGATVDNARQAAERVSKATERLEGMADSLDEALTQIKGVSGDASGFVEKVRPALEEIILDVRETVWHLKAFARQIEEQPESVIRGATPQGRRP